MEHHTHCMQMYFMMFCSIEIVNNSFVVLYTFQDYRVISLVLKRAVACYAYTRIRSDIAVIDGDAERTDPQKVNNGMH